jgi:hypothetical protein
MARLVEFGQTVLIYQNMELLEKYATMAVGNL